MKRTLTLLSALACILTVQAQTYNEMDADGNITQRDEYNNGNFNPNKRDSTHSNKEIPISVRAWTVDRRFGDIQPAKVDTLPHLYQNTVHNSGLYGQYNTLGNNYTARQNRIFIDRPQISEFFFTQPYDFTIKEPDQFLFVNTLSPYTNITYEPCGDQQNGEDHIEGKFSVNANKRLGLGFDLDYHYATGYFANQNNANFRASLFSSYIGDRYQMHFLTSFYHRKVTESGGITDDNYITHPEAQETEYAENEIPTILSENWNRNDSKHVFFTHRYNLGFYRKVKMTDEEIKARQFASKSAQQNSNKDKDEDGKKPSGLKGAKKADIQPAGRPANAKIMGDEPTPEKPVEADTTRIKVDSQEKMDSLLAEAALQDSIDATMKKEYVPVTSFIHTLELNSHDRIYQAYKSPKDYYADTYYDLNDEGTYSGDSIYDNTKFLSIKNTFAIALLEGFNKYMKAGMKVFLSHEYRKYQMPDITEDDNTAYFMNKWTENNIAIGGQISKTQGQTLHFNLAAEFGMTGSVVGDMSVDFNTDLNFRLFGDTVTLAAKAYFYRLSPAFFMENYHSKHLWWSHSFSKETRTHIEGLFSYRKTDTHLRVAIDEIQNYTYFGMSYTVGNKTRTGLTGDVYQASGNINVLTAQLMQNVRWGILNWENVITYQNSSNQDVLPLPALNLFSNLYLKFRIARVLSVELGGCATFFTKYEAPDYLPQIAQYAIQKEQDSRVLLGGYPFVDVYANCHLKRARFFVAMTHVNAGSGTKMQFLAPHHPTNSRVLRFGVSWNFFN